MLIDDPISFISPFRRYTTLTVGLVLAVMLIWGPLNTIWPVAALAIGLEYMATFFHELGHTAFSWIFGYPALPAFDFEHGGGMSWHLDREMILQYGLLAAAAYGVWFVWRHHVGLGIAAALLFLAYIAAAFTGFHDALILFMGNGTEVVIGSYVIARVICDAVPPRPGELEIHALAGWFMVLHPLHLSLGLLYDPDVQDMYWHQKGAEGFGDFSRVADYFGFVNEGPVAWFCIAFAIIGLIAPFIYQRWFAEL